MATLRFGKPWDREEEDELLCELSNGMSVQDIAKKHGRTPGGIRSRQDHIAKRLVCHEGFSIEHAALKVKKNVCDVQSLLERREITLQRAQPKSKPPKRGTVLVEIRDLLKEMVANQKKILTQIE